MNLREAGLEVALVEALPHILRTFDHDMAQLLQKEMLDHGVKVVVGDAVSAFEGSNVTLASGATIAGDAVVMAVGVRPDTALASAAGLATNERGAIIVDAGYGTSDPDIFAVGDAIEVHNALTHAPMMLQLAGPAQKQACQVADRICGLPVRNTGNIGSTCIQVFGLNAASTGLTATQCEAAGLAYDYAYVLPADRVSLMPGSTALHLKVIFGVPTGRVLGAQAISAGDAPKRVDVIATLIKFGGTVDDLRDLELCYAPPFSTAKDLVNYAGLVAENLLQGAYRQVHVDEVRGLSALLGCFVPCHGCIDNAIHSASGLQLRDACADIMRAQGHEEPAGRAKITPGFNLPARNVIHTVGPIVTGSAPTVRDRRDLASCYRSCLELAAEQRLSSVSFCCISTGEFRFPQREAAHIAVATVRAFLDAHPAEAPGRVVFNVFKDEDMAIYRELLDSPDSGALASEQVERNR